MTRIMGSILHEEMDAIHGLEYHTQIMFMMHITPWVENIQGIRIAKLHIRNLQMFSSIEGVLSITEVDESMEALQKRNVLKIINKTKDKYNVELLFSE